MYQVNDHVVYGNHGICAVKDIGPLELANTLADRLYYTLEPLFSQKTTIYTPVDNKKASIRRAITGEEAQGLLRRLPDVEVIWVTDDKRREEKYKEIMKKNDCGGWMQIIKTLYLKKQKRLSEGKKSTARDDLYLKVAEDFLYREFAAALGIEPIKVKDLFDSQVYALETETV